MHLSVYISLLACAACLAHFRGYESRNLIERDETHSKTDGTLVECPVCEMSPSGIPTREKCNILEGNKKYKRCHRGTYVNDVCGNRLDCYRGPGEQCTEKMDYDYYGQKCAPAFYCEGTLHVCIGLGYTPDSRLRFYLSHLHRYPLLGQKDELAENSAMFLA